MLHDMIGVVTFGSALGTAVPLAHVMRCSIASNDKYKVRYLQHGVMLTEATGDAELVVRDAGELPHSQISL